MNTPHLTTPLVVDTLWHTNWGFCVRTILDGYTADFFLDGRISGSHRSYVETFIDGERVEHENTFNKQGTRNALLPDIVAHVRARIVATGDDIPLDPVAAIQTVEALWWKRIAAAKKEDRPSLAEQQRKLCEAFQSVIDGRVPTLVALNWILGICVGFEKFESNPTT